MVTLKELGPRICILGPSNSGKSTLASAIGRVGDLVPIHLDQLHHYPHTDWQPRPEAEFAALHAKAIAEPTWVMDGNYSRYLPQRLARATGIILLDTPTSTSLYRYLRRTWFERVRRGQLVGSRQRVKWTTIRHLATTTRANRHRYQELFSHWTLPKIRLATTQEVACFYRRAGLSR